MIPAQRTPADVTTAPVTYSPALHVDPQPTPHTCGTMWRAGVRSSNCYGCGGSGKTVAR